MALVSQVLQRNKKPSSAPCQPEHPSTQQLEHPSTCQLEHPGALSTRASQCPINQSMVVHHQLEHPSTPSTGACLSMVDMHVLGTAHGQVLHA